MLHLVFGPPCAGKTTFVREHRADNDIIIDRDALGTALGCPAHTPYGAWWPMAQKLSEVAADMAVAWQDTDVWITSIHYKELRRLKARATVPVKWHRIDPGMAVCLRRLSDLDRAPGTADLIRRWYKENKQ